MKKTPAEFFATHPDLDRGRWKMNIEVAGTLYSLGEDVCRAAISIDFETMLVAPDGWRGWPVPPPPALGVRKSTGQRTVTIEASIRVCDETRQMLLDLARDRRCYANLGDDAKRTMLGASVAVTTQYHGARDFWCDVTFSGGPLGEFDPSL